MDLEKLKAQLQLEEGSRLFPYVDTVGKLTIGIGHNLTDCGISLAVQDLLFQEDVSHAQAVLTALLPEWPTFLEPRQRAFLDLAFNLGPKLRQFHQFLACARLGDWEGAARELQNSRWFTQVGTRGPRLLTQIKTGVDPVVAA